MTAHKRDQLEALFHVAMYRHRGAAKKNLAPTDVPWSGAQPYLSQMMKMGKELPSVWTEPAIDC